MRVAVVGIDGTGKTTALRSPFAELSTALTDASAAADTLGRVHLKVAVLYLQLCLYGPAERHATGQGRTVRADRHPLIDSLVYLPLFGRIEPNDARRRCRALVAEAGPRRRAIGPERCGGVPGSWIPGHWGWNCPG